MTEKLRVGIVFAAVAFMAANAGGNDGSKIFKWVDLQKGDCHLSGTLTISPDGKAHFDATTWTGPTHAGDIWHTVIRVYDDQKKIIFTLGPWDSPRMVERAQYRWKGEGVFPPNVFDSVQSVSADGSAC